MNNRAINIFKITIPSKSINESFIRVVVSAFIAHLDPSTEELADIRTSVSEAVTNCVVHAYKHEQGNITITASYDKDNVVKIVIADRGCGIEDIPLAMQPLYTSDNSGERGGMGFAVMKTFMDKLKVRSTPGKGTQIIMWKKIGSIIHH